MLKPLRLLSLLACLWAALGLSAQMPVTAEMTAEIETSAPGAGVLVINVSVADGWHIYGLEMNTDDPYAPDPTTVTIDAVDGLTMAGPLECSVEAIEHYDTTAELSLPWLMGSFTLRQPFELSGAEGCRIKGTVRYMACNDVSCTPPATFEFDLPFGTGAADSVC